MPFAIWGVLPLMERSVRAYRRFMLTMTNLHALAPCALCCTRMAIPGSPVCTICDAVVIPAMVPANVASLR